MREKRVSSLSKVVGALTISATLLGAAAYRYGELWLRTGLYNVFKLSTPFLVLILCGLIAPLVAGVWLLIRGLGTNHYGEKPRRKPAIIGGMLVAFSLVNLIPGNGLLLSKALRTGHDTLAVVGAEIRRTAQPHPEYLRRPNSVQAARLIEELNNDPLITDVSEVQYSRADGEPAWCAGAYGRADWAGRRYTTAVVCITENQSVVRANWGGAVVPSIRGKFSTNLSKKIAELEPGTSLAEEDLRFAIVDGKPNLIGALTTISAGMHPRTLPAGVVHIDADGRMRLDAEVSEGEYGVAVVPYAVARDVRRSLNTRGGYWCGASWNLNRPKCLEVNTPYEDTGSIAQDVNSENFSEFVLLRADGGVSMVTPLTYYGKGRNITAYLDIEVGSVTAGVMPAATLHEGVNEVAYRTLVQTLTPAYTADLTWLTEIDGNGDTATASRIYEITPTKPGEMLLTIGTATNAQYYVEIEATVSGGSLEFSWCIYGDTRRELEARALDCRSRGDGEAPIGTLRGVAIGGSVDAQPTPGELNGSNLDLSQLSADELKELINNAVEELSRR